MPSVVVPTHDSVYQDTEASIASHSAYNFGAPNDSKGKVASHSGVEDERP